MLDINTHQWICFLDPSTNCKVIDSGHIYFQPNKHLAEHLPCKSIAVQSVFLVTVRPEWFPEAGCLFCLCSCGSWWTCASTQTQKSDQTSRMCTTWPRGCMPAWPAAERMDGVEDVSNPSSSISVQIIPPCSWVLRLIFQS